MNSGLVVTVDCSCTTASTSVLIRRCLSTAGSWLKVALSAAISVCYVATITHRERETMSVGFAAR